MLPGFSAAANDEFVLINNDGSDAVVGTFNGLAEGQIIALGVPNTGTPPPNQLPGQLFQISYVGGTGNDVVLTASPAVATTDVELVLNGTTNLIDLVITDFDEGPPATSDNGNSADEWTIFVDGSEVVIQSNNVVGTLSNGPTQNSFNEIRVDTSLFTGNVVVNSGDLDDVITIGDLGSSVLPLGISVIGGDGFDRIVYTGDGSVLEDINGTGEKAHATFIGEEVDFILSDLSTTDGNISVTATRTGSPTLNYVGIDLLVSDLSAGGTGTITLIGQGGDTGNYNHGIRLTPGSDLTTTDGNITLTGTGGDSSGLFNQGIHFSGGGAVGSPTRVTLSAGGDGNLMISGQGGNSGSSFNEGIFAGSTDFSVVDGALSVSGTGGTGTGLGNRGVQLINSGFTASGGGSVTISGQGSGTGSHNTGALLTVVSITTNDGAITLSGTGSSTGTSYNQGLKLAGSTVTSTSGNIELDGTGNGGALFNTGVALLGTKLETAGNGTINVDGTGGNGTIFNEGVQMLGSTVQSENGVLNISGTGQGSLLGNRGLNITGGRIESTGTGSVSLTGRGSTTSSSVYNTGILMSSGTVKSGNGGIAMTGISGSGSSLNQGLRIVFSTIDASTGVLGMTGTSNGTSGVFNNGVYILGGTLNGGGGSTIEGTGGSGTSYNYGVYIANVGGNLGIGNVTSNPGGGDPNDPSDDPYVKFV